MTATPDVPRGARGLGPDPRISLGREGARPAGLPAELFRRISERQRAHERYRLGEELARGGQGVVLSVWDEDLRRSLAMKVLLGAIGEEADQLGLDSPGRSYFTMKLVKGRDLRAIFELVQGGAEGPRPSRSSPNTSVRGPIA